MPNGLFNLKQQLRGIQQGAWTGQKTPAVNYLVVAGGGGGGSRVGGGGGAGGFLQGNIPVAIGSSLTVTVGAGGAGGVDNTSASVSGSNSVFSSISALGGGRGSDGRSPGNTLAGTGGSGGGGSYGANPNGFGTFGQGNAGSAGLVSTTGNYWIGGGGGGAGTPAIAATNNGTSSLSGGGGAGIASDISGTRTVYAGGGGGGSELSTAGTGGVGGGGNGQGSGGNGGAGTANTGGGGGGGTQPTNNGGAGGSGIVIISYPDTYAAATSTTGSPTVSTSGSGSISFNGSSQFLNAASLTNMALGTGDFTVEGWFYQTADNTYPIALEIGDHGSSTGVAFMTKNSGNATLYSGAFYGTQATTLNAWNHIAWVRSSGTLKIYVNGVGGTGVAFTNNLTNVSQVTIGKTYYYTPTSYWYTGYISNLRVVKAAVYTTNFTPSTAPLTAITNTQLLMNTVSGAMFADASTNAYALTSATPPVWNSSSPFSTGLGYKNRVYTWTSSGSITF